MHCTNCQKELSPGAKFCSECGTRVLDRSDVAITQTVKTAQDNAGIAGTVSGKDVQVGGERYEAEGNIVIATEGSTVVIREAPTEIDTPAVNGDSALAHYLRHIISRNRYLQHQGIRSGGKLVHVELEQIYVRLRATRQRTVEAERAWLETETKRAPGEPIAPGEAQLRRAPRHSELAEESRRTQTETVTVNVDEALAEHPHLVVLGNPGSGKTTLLRYLALLYARDLAEGTSLVHEKLGLPGEDGRLPILLPLRRFGKYLETHHPKDDGTEGLRLLLDLYYQTLESERVSLPANFLDPYLDAGRAVVLLDGLDEVADKDLRRRVSRIVDAFTAAYPGCRYLVASRIVGYTDAARLGEEYTTTTIRDFTLADVERFLRNWHRAVSVGQMGPGESAMVYAEGQTQALLAAIKKNERVRALAINPLMLTVIALVHRDRVKLPDRRAELYDEAVSVLLGKWDEARGVQEVSILPDQPFDAGDRRLMLQAVALWMQERQQKEIETDDLRRLLGEMFQEIVIDWRAASRAVDRFLHVIQERTGLLGEHGVGVYRYSHLTFQEYLAALEVAGRDDYVPYTLERAGVPWWKEVILLEAGHLSTQSRGRTTRLIRAIAEKKEEPEPYHNLVLAAQCLRDVGPGRVEGDLQTEIQEQLRRELETTPPTGRFAQVQVLLQRRMSIEELARRRVAAAQALAQIGSTEYWTPPHGEPEWIEIPTGEFWMGDGSESHQVHLDTFYISRVPITNAQYRLFVEDTDREPPSHWEEDRPPPGKESHPVVNVTWHDALAYCQWLSQKTDKPVTLPSEAEWEKAARGDQDRREYPWGDEFDAARCNSGKLGLEDTTPVGIFPGGASPYGVLDMAGNVWEWTRSLWGQMTDEWDMISQFSYPYDSTDGRENLKAGKDWPRVVRGGAFNNSVDFVRCAYRYRDLTSYDDAYDGFRVVVVPISRSALG